MSGRLDWARDGRDWPNRDASRFVSAAGFKWHVQILGAGPPVLLLHGTGASSHSWRGIAPILGKHFTVITPDLPGHGFTQMPRGNTLTLDGMARATRALLDRLEKKPILVIGHSAGAAILVRMCIDRSIGSPLVIGVNAALLPFGSASGPLFTGLAKLLALNPIVHWAVSIQGLSGRMVERLLDETGSRIDPEGVTLYRRLVGSAGHVSAALKMMANWDLNSLEADLSKLATRLHLLVGTRDRAVSPDQAFRLRGKYPGVKITSLKALGHLAHEEKPELVARHILRIAEEAAPFAALPS